MSLVKNILMDHANLSQWDKTFSKRELIQTFPEENGASKSYYHNTIKFPAFMSDRDVVVE